MGKSKELNTRTAMGVDLGNDAKNDEREEKTCKSTRSTIGVGLGDVLLRKKRRKACMNTRTAIGVGLRKRRDVRKGVIKRRKTS
jgi:hypothetical protein